MSPPPIHDQTPDPPAPVDAAPVDPESVLVVGDDRSPPLAGVLRLLSEGGIRFVLVGDVYSAMARLAGYAEMHHVIVDIRPLDRVEAAFLYHAPRYYPSTEFIVPLLPGTEDRLASMEPNPPRPIFDRPPLSPERIVEHLRVAQQGDRPPASSVISATADPRPAESHHDDASAGGLSPPFQSQLVAGSVDTQSPIPSPLSTDGGPEAADGGPPLHEAVRLRMGGGAAPVIRRRPPGQTPTPDRTDESRGGPA